MAMTILCQRKFYLGKKDQEVWKSHVPYLILYQRTIRSEENIKLDLEETGYEGGVVWINLPWNKGQWQILVEILTKLQVAQNMG